MRLTCPNCKAQYEVEDAVVPPEGRDVQCSSCGTTWFQYPASVALQMRAADIDDDDDDDDRPGAAAPESAPGPGAGSAAGSAGQRLDRTVLDVLRQEAERELAERRRAQPGIATQADLGLLARPRSRGPAATARPPSDLAGAANGAGAGSGGDPKGASGAGSRSGSGVVAGAAPSGGDSPAGGSRGELLPDIEELSSTLAAHPPSASEAPAAIQPEEVQRGREFRRGVSAVLLVIAVLLALYMMAPTLGEMVPPLAGALAGYVAMIDALRATISGLFAAG